MIGPGWTVWCWDNRAMSAGDGWPRDPRYDGGEGMSMAGW